MVWKTSTNACFIVAPEKMKIKNQIKNTGGHDGISATFENESGQRNCNMPTLFYVVHNSGRKITNKLIFEIMKIGRPKISAIPQIP